MSDDNGQERNREKHGHSMFTVRSNSNSDIYEKRENKTTNVAGLTHLHFLSLDGPV